MHLQNYNKLLFRKKSIKKTLELFELWTDCLTFELSIISLLLQNYIEKYRYLFETLSIIDYNSAAEKPAMQLMEFNIHPCIRKAITIKA